ncbi:unnamed protein product [Vitrella brassicaformis CCMP3155]|uniref:Letm1 RBD domain-containing protein n=2 Tax=Vitrella brassicaformis TaxID=1169539 RepID=A0A0G4F870_VITBC|nr:unnamed protein product [Vitrella brassicaformis CCMP3155]|eukprot:CEM08914.1 unnamed protein product [Vitrella brassicaformis CCMP3155]
MDLHPNCRPSHPGPAVRTEQPPRRRRQPHGQPQASAVAHSLPLLLLSCLIHPALSSLILSRCRPDRQLPSSPPAFVSTPPLVVRTPAWARRSIHQLRRGDRSLVGGLFSEKPSPSSASTSTKEKESEPRASAAVGGGGARSSSASTSASASSPPYGNETVSVDEQWAVNVEDLRPEDVTQRAIATGQAFYRSWRGTLRFLVELWERLNGIPPGFEDEQGEGRRAALSLAEQIEASPSIQNLRAYISQTEDELPEARKERARLREVLVDIRSTSSEDVGVRADVERELSRADRQVQDLKRQLKFQQVELDLKRLELLFDRRNITIPSYTPNSNNNVNLNVNVNSNDGGVRRDVVVGPSASVGGMGMGGSAQMGAVSVQFQGLLREYLRLEGKLNRLLKIWIQTGTLSLSDEGTLAVLSVEVKELKARAGLELPPPKPFAAGLQRGFDWATIKASLEEQTDKIRNGVAFYWLGTRLLVSDIQYAIGLFKAAAFDQYTLSPREVSALRRTGRDLLNLVPFTIILIIPLSPVGHVLVFSFIQRFFPNFFPSPYTDRRQEMARYFQSRGEGLPSPVLDIDIEGNPNTQPDDAIDAPTPPEEAALPPFAQAKMDKGGDDNGPQPSPSLSPSPSPSPPSSFPPPDGAAAGGGVGGVNGYDVGAADSKSGVSKSKKDTVV